MAEKVNIKNIGKRKSAYGDYYVSDTERIIVGEKIPASQRKIFTPKEYGSNWVSGSIGFLDFCQEDNAISVGEMGIEPQYQGRGFGEMLVEKVEQIAEERGMETIRFIAIEEGNEPMINLLKKRGYRPIRGFNPEIFVKETKISNELG